MEAGFLIFYLQGIRMNICFLILLCGYKDFNHVGVRRTDYINPPAPLEQKKHQRYCNDTAKKDSEHFKIYKCFMHD